jgi:hypothetical protein
MSVFDIIGLVGVAVILAGYAAATLGKLKSDGAPSLALNFVGASLILLSLTQAFNLSAAIVEGAWALIALIGLARIALTRLRRD